MKKITELETDLDLEALKRKSAESSDSAEIMRKKLLEEQKQLIRVTADVSHLSCMKWSKYTHGMRSLMRLENGIDFPGAAQSKSRQDTSSPIPLLQASASRMGRTT